MAGIFLSRRIISYTDQWRDPAVLDFEYGSLTTTAMSAEKAKPCHFTYLVWKLDASSTRVH